MPQILSTFLLCTTLLSKPRLAASLQSSGQSLAAQYSLSTSTTLPFPSATQKSSDAQALIVSEWGLNKGRIQDGASNLAFINDPFPKAPAPGASSNTNSTGPVLEVTYPAGSFSHDTGGSQLYNLWNTSDGSAFQSMLMSYEVAFDSGFDWVKGGKLPGLRGGLDSTGCSGGNQANGKDCFSTRLMWRDGGAGEVYSYIPSPNNLCSEKSITCNSDFGISISRGAFSFISGEWNRITLLVQLNNPPNVANGNLQLFFNDLQAISQQDLQIRSSSSVNIGGLYFSTFFGGSDDSWATPNTVRTYFRDIRLWGGSAPSNLTGRRVKGAAIRGSSSVTFSIAMALVTALVTICI